MYGSALESCFGLDEGNFVEAVWLDRAPRLLPLTALYLDVDVDQRHGSRRNARNSAGLPKRLRSNAMQLLIHLA